MDLITYGLLNKSKANLDSPAFTGTPTAPTPATTDNTTKLATTEFVRSFVATLKGFYLGVTTTTLVDEVTTDPNVVINGETVAAEDGNWVIASGGEEFVYSGTVWQKFGDSNWISVIGDTYKSNLTYNTHDCVIYMDGLYECQEDNVTGDWDSTKWQATTVIDLITGGIPLENLSNVDIVNPQVGNHLVFDGTKWKNSTIVSPALSELSDVELENVTDGQALIYNDTTDKWENQNIPTGQPTKTATGNPIEITDAAAAPLVKCVTEIQGSQDLHGYDKPWVGGSGKNKCYLDDFSSTQFSFTASASNNVLRFSGKNTSAIGTDWSAWKNIKLTVTTRGRYNTSFRVNGQIISFGYTYYDENDQSHSSSSDLDPGNYTVGIYLPAGTNYTDGADIYVQTELGSSATSWEPYSNICPITAYTENTVSVGHDMGIPIESGTINSNGTKATSTVRCRTGEFINLVANKNYKVIVTTTQSKTINVGYLFWATNTFGSNSITYDSGWLAVPFIISPTVNKYCTMSIRYDDNSNISPDDLIVKIIEVEQESTTTFPSAIYRGSEDVVNGSVTAGWRKVVLDGSSDEGWSFATYGSKNIAYRLFNDIALSQIPIANIFNGVSNRSYNDLNNWECASPISPGAEKYINFVCDNTITSLADFLTFLGNNNLEVAYTLATPTTSSVTPTNLPIRTLSGYNHIESSTGEMEVEYITENQQPIIDLIDTKADNVDMVGAAAAASGSHGLVPAPSTGDQGKFLKGDGTWSNIPAELPSVTSTDDNKVLTVVNGAWTKANPQTGMSESVIADEYDSTKTYNIADYCMHNSKLYKCNTANTTGAWDSTKWDETCIGDELTLKNAVVVAPTVNSSVTYTYNGTEQTLTFTYINSESTIVTGNKHTDAGTYTCTVSLKNPNDLWSDTMDNVDKTFTWTINKVTSSITLSPTTFYFDNGTPQTLTATVVGQPLVLSGYDTSLITITQVSVINGVYTYNIKATGTAGTTTITASIAESTNYTAASATASVETEAFTPGATLVPWSSGTDQEITDMINSYYNGEITLEDVKSVWSIGDVRNVDISAMTATGVGESHRAQTVEMEILDFDHDTLTTPVGNITKALITVDMKNCLRDANVTDTTGSSNTEHGYMNSSNTNVGGWTSCARRTWCNNVFYNALPSYFKSLVKPVDKLTSAGNQSSIINTDSDYCFLLSEIEIFGSVIYSKAGEGSQYAWFANATANRYKLPKWNSSSVSGLWWERSPRGSNSGHFCTVGRDGSAGNSYASSALGLAPACCL